MPHILAIDDEEPIRDILQQVLTAGGYRVTTAEAAAGALDIIRLDPPDLIITDFQLADSDGLELVDQIRLIAPRVPIVLLTGVLFDPATIKRLDEQHIAYVDKTSSLERILSEVRRLLQK